MSRDGPSLASGVRASGALGESDVIANTVLLLASDESKFINGAATRVDIAESVMEGVVSLLVGAGLTFRL